MLLDPFEEQLDLPAQPVELGDRKRRQGKVVGQEHEPLARFGILEFDPAQRRLEALLGVKAGEHDGLVADKPRTPVYRMRVTALRLEVGFGADDEEAAGVLEATQALEVEIAPIHHVEGARLGEKLIQDVDLVQLAVADEDKGRNVAAQVQERVQLDRGLGGAKRRPGEHGEAQIDRGGIERIDGVLQIEPKGLVDVEASCGANQALREFAVDAPVAGGVGIGQRVARDLASDAQVVKLGSLGAKTRLDIAQTFAVGKLRKGHAQILVEAGEPLDLAMPFVPRDTTTEGGERQMFHHLRENEFACVHTATSRLTASQGRRFRNNDSNRHQANSRFPHLGSMTYRLLTVKRWDSTEVN